VWKSAIKCDGSALLTHLKAGDHGSMVDPSVVDRGAERLYCNTFSVLSPIVLPQSNHSLTIPYYSIYTVYIQQPHSP
jgi:hypothetical protein